MVRLTLKLCLLMVVLVAVAAHPRHGKKNSNKLSKRFKSDTSESKSSFESESSEGKSSKSKSSNSKSSEKFSNGDSSSSFVEPDAETPEQTDDVIVDSPIVEQETIETTPPTTIGMSQNYSAVIK